MVVLVVVIVFCLVLQDIVFDVWKIDVLLVEECGVGVVISVLGYCLGMLVFGGLVLWFVDCYFGWQGMYWLMVVLLVFCIIVMLLVFELSDVILVFRLFEQVVVELLCDFFGCNNVWLILLFIVFYKFGDVFVMSLIIIFLICGVGFDVGEVGMVNKILGLFVIIFGVLYGGVLMQWLMLFWVLFIFGLLQGVFNVGYWLLLIIDKYFYFMVIVVFFENLCGGMGMVVFVVLLMMLCNKLFFVIQFVLFLVFFVVGCVYVGLIVGWFVEVYGWLIFYFFFVVVVVLGIVLLLLCW